MPFVVKYDAYHNSAEGGKRKEGKSESRRQKKQSKAERRNEKVAQLEYDHLQCSQDIHDVHQDILVTEPPRKLHKLGKNKKGKRDEQSERRVVEFRPSDQGFEEQYYHSRERRAKQEKKRQDGTNLISRRESALRNNNQVHGRRATQKKNRSQKGPNLISNGKNLHIIFNEHYTF